MIVPVINGMAVPRSEGGGAAGSAVFTSNKKTQAAVNRRPVHPSLQGMCHLTAVLGAKHLLNSPFALLR